MTRDEAIAISIQCRGGNANRTANQTRALHENAGRRVDSYAALGMLKLDEPKIPDRMIAKLQNTLDFIKPTATPAELKYWLEASGLGIVEK